MADVDFRSFEKLAQQSMSFLNDQIKAVDWNKRWQINYPKTERSKQEAEALKKPEVKEALKEVFTEQSLVMSKLREVF